MNELKQLYYDPEQGFLSAVKLWKKAKQLGINVTSKQVKEFLKQQSTYQLNLKDKKPSVYNSINAEKYGDNFQMDIMIYDRYEYHNYKYVLGVIDVHSRYVACRAMTNREMKTILKNFNDICVNDMGFPKHLNADNEFNKKEFNAYLHSHNITAHYSYADDVIFTKNSIIERFWRTLAGLLQKWRVAHKRYDWYDVLPQIVKNYNKTEHRTIKASPLAIRNGEEQSKAPIRVLKPKLQIGDAVRIKIWRKVLYHGDQLTYTQEIYKIIRREGHRFILQDYDGNELHRGYKEYELQRLSEEENEDYYDDYDGDAGDNDEKEFPLPKRKKKRYSPALLEDISENKIQPKEAKRKAKLPTHLQDYNVALPIHHVSHNDRLGQVEIVENPLQEQRVPVERKKPSSAEKLRIDMNNVQPVSDKRARKPVKYF